MKQLTIVRHAKSSWEFPELSDFDRPLNNRGNRDAPKMAAFLKEQSLQLGNFYSSPAKRALETAQYFAKEFEVEKKDIQMNKKLYLPSFEDLRLFFGQLNDDINSITVFSHNPGVLNLVSKLSGEYWENIPTCGVAVLKLDIKFWSEILQSKAILLDYYYPKGI